jgi:integrase
MVKARQLTATTIGKIKGAAMRLEIPDAGAPGLRLIIQPSGAKSWAMRFRRPDGKPAKLTLGKVDLSGKEPASQPVIGQHLSLKAARALASEISRQRALDVDVIAARKLERSQRRSRLLRRSSDTFAMAARDFIDDHKVARSGKRPRRWRSAARLLGLDYGADDAEPTVIKNGLCDIWADKPIAEITADDIYHLIEEARRHGVPGIERRKAGTSDPRGRSMADAVGTMFKYLHRHRRVASNPCVGIHRPAHPASRKRVLNVKTDVRNADELRHFWHATDHVAEPFGSLMRLLILTGCRLNELACMRWDELTDDRSTIHLPVERTKNGRPHDVPLAPLARRIIEGLPKLSPKFVFTTNGKTPVSGFSKIKARLDADMLEEAKIEHGEDAALPPWRIHDLRRTAATGMAGIGVAPHVVEAALNHVSGAKAGVAGTYNVETYEPEKREASERWANYVEGIVTGRKAKVVPLGGRGKR